MMISKHSLVTLVAAVALQTIGIVGVPDDVKLAGSEVVLLESCTKYKELQGKRLYVKKDIVKRTHMFGLVQIKAARIEYNGSIYKIRKKYLEVAPPKKQPLKVGVTYKINNKYKDPKLYKKSWKTFEEGEEVEVVEVNGNMINVKSTGKGAVFSEIVPEFCLSPGEGCPYQQGDKVSVLFTEKGWCDCYIIDVDNEEKHVRVCDSVALDGNANIKDTDWRIVTFKELDNCMKPLSGPNYFERRRIGKVILGSYTHVIRDDGTLTKGTRVKVISHCELNPKTHCVVRTDALEYHTIEKDLLAPPPNRTGAAAVSRSGTSSTSSILKSPSVCPYKKGDKVSVLWFGKEKNEWVDCCVDYVDQEKKAVWFEYSKDPELCWIRFSKINEYVKPRKLSKRMLECYKRVFKDGQTILTNRSLGSSPLTWQNAIYCEAETIAKDTAYCIAVQYNLDDWSGTDVKIKSVDNKLNVGLVGTIVRVTHDLGKGRVKFLVAGSGKEYICRKKQLTLLNKIEYEHIDNIEMWIPGVYTTKYNKGDCVESYFRWKNGKSSQTRKGTVEKSYKNGDVKIRFHSGVSQTISKDYIVRSLTSKPNSSVIERWLHEE